MNKTIFGSILIILTSCNLFDSKDVVLMTNQDFFENSRELSPDKSMLILNYSKDLGAFGYGQGGTAILNVSDTTKNLLDYSLPSNLINVKWLDNRTAFAQVDILHSLRTGEKIKIADTNINNVKVKVSAWDYIENDDHLEIEHKETSPNGKLELVAYRYLKDRRNLNFIHVSIIPVGGQIPKYGNYFIADMQSDYILYGTWDKENQLIFYSNKQDANFIQYFLVNNRPKIEYQIITDDSRYGSKYRWIEKGSH